MKSGYLDASIHGILGNFRILGYQGKDTRILGCKKTMIQGYIDARIPGIPGTIGTYIKIPLICTKLKC